MFWAVRYQIKDNPVPSNMTSISLTFEIRFNNIRDISSPPSNVLRTAMAMPCCNNVIIF